MEIFTSKSDNFLVKLWIEEVLKEVLPITEVIETPDSGNDFKTWLFHKVGINQFRKNFSIRISPV